MKNTKLKIFIGLIILKFIAIGSLGVIYYGKILPDQNAKRMNQKGLSEFNAGHPEKAIPFFKAAIAVPWVTTATKAVVYRNIALAYTNMKDENSALYYYKLAAGCCDSKSYEYLVNMSEIDIINENMEDAIIKLEKAVVLKPNDFSAYNTLGLIYLGEYGVGYADLTKALKYNKKAFELGRDRITEFVLAKTYYGVGEFEYAEKHFEILSQKYPDNITHTLNLGMVKYKLNKKEEAREIWDMVEQADSSYRYQIEKFIENNEE